MNMTPNQEEMLSALQKEILVQAANCAAEQHDPRPDADAMDEYIKRRKENVALLRDIREKLENMITGILL